PRAAVPAAPSPSRIGELSILEDSFEWDPAATGVAAAGGGLGPGAGAAVAGNLSSYSVFDDSPLMARQAGDSNNNNYDSSRNHDERDIVDTAGGDKSPAALGKGRVSCLSTSGASDTT
ncbi:unnamed protein product, partial [Scytosiphon promiscuus]